MFPNRSGAEVVYLEQAFPRPKYLVSTAFAVVTVLLSYGVNSLRLKAAINCYSFRMSVTNCVVFAQYFMASLDITPTPTRQTLISLAVATASSAGMLFTLGYEFFILCFASGRCIYKVVSAYHQRPHCCQGDLSHFVPISLRLYPIFRIIFARV